MKLRVVLSVVLGLTVALLSAAAAYAHGERAQEGFLRMETLAWSDVKFSGDTVAQGERLTISGRVRILETWPRTIGEPQVGFFNVDAPGPVFLLKDRVVNGQEAPHALYVEKGGLYEFTITLEGRKPGQYHVHPTLAIGGAGTLIGPGKWITVEESGAGSFTNPVKLLNGQTVDLETYTLAPLVGWHWLGFFLGLGWMVYWTGPKPTVTRLAITSRIPLNTDGQDVGLITKKDHRVVNIFAFATVVMLLAGLVYQQLAFPVKLPQQVIRFEPPALPQPPSFVEAAATRATYDPQTHAMVMEVEVKNLGDKPMNLARFTTSNLVFVNQAMAGTGTERVMVVEPNGAINPGETRSLKLTLRDSVWTDERLIQFDKPRTVVTGSLGFEDAEGASNVVTVQSGVIPAHFAMSPAH
jgi:methane/ammonia monooxygenase subunit B